MTLACCKFFYGQGFTSFTLFRGHDVNEESAAMCCFNTTNQYHHRNCKKDKPHKHKGLS